MRALVDLGKRGMREMSLTAYEAPSSAVAANLTTHGWEPQEWLGETIQTGRQRPMCALVRREISTGIYRAVLALPSNSPTPQKKTSLGA
jgi:hypothetical protein